MKTLSAKSLAIIGVLAGMSAVLMLFDFPLPFAPTFLKFDISDVPGLFAGFFLGPLHGFLTAVIKIILNLILNGTTTAGIGELSNLFGSTLFIGTASIIYRKYHNKYGALAGLAASAILTSAAYVYINAFVTFPVYGKLYGLSTDKIIAMARAVNPLVKDLPTMLYFSVLPFNLVKYAIVSLISYLTYLKTAKPLKDLLRI